MHNMRGTDAVVECLRRMEVRRVYGVIGTSIVGLLDGLYVARNDIRYISCRHEQVAASMADAEGRLTRRPGVVALHSGPGALNAMISLANAAKDCSPVLAITGAIKRRLRGCDGMLELDHVQVFRPLCRGTFRVDATYEIPRIFTHAFRAALQGPGGPVLVEVPEDIWTDHAEVDLDALDLTLETVPPPANDLVKSIASRLAQAERPVILAGAGVAYSHSADRLRQLVERLQVPVATTGNGRAVLPETHPLSLGRAGYGGGNPVADEALKRSDFLLAIGCTVSDMTSYEYTWPIEAEVVVVNLDRDNDLKKIPLEAVYADAAQFLEQLWVQVQCAEVRSHATWHEELSAPRAMWQNLVQGALSGAALAGSPARVCRALDEMLPEDAIVAVGAGMHLLYPMAFMRSRQPSCFLSAVNFGAMGFGFPAALGAKLVFPNRTVVAILGDGDFLMTVQDLETAVREQIAVRIFVVNDNAYRVLAFRQRVQYQGHVYGSEHKNPDLMKLAESFGLPAWRIETADQIAETLSEAMAARGPSLVEIVTDTNDIPPTNLQAALRMSE
jgi:acetolactate synthase I/II/III large subunit